MEITPFVVATVAIVGGNWTMSAGAQVQRYHTEPTPRRKHIAIGNTVVSLLPLALRGLALRASLNVPRLGVKRTFPSWSATA